MPNIKQLLEKELIPIIKKGYEEACYYWKIIPTKKVIFKGFFSQETYKEILSNEEILTNLGADSPRLKKIFGEELESLILAKSGVALPAKWETWIIINPFYLELELSPKLMMELVETVAHETAHAVIFNWDIYWAHAEPHREITKYCQDYYWRNYDWEKLFK